MAEIRRAVSITFTGIEAMQNMLDPVGVRRALEDGLTDVAIQVTADAKEEAPVRSARLVRTIRVFGRQSGPTRVIVAGDSSVNYAAAQHEGSRPHEIRPRHKKMLFFPSQKVTTERFGDRAKLTFRKSGKLSNRSMRRYGNAAYVLTRKVNHPGNPAVPFMRNAIEKAPIARILAEAMRRHYLRHRR